MAKVTVEKITYAPYGECLKVTNGEKELIATLERGPYIVRYAYVGEENMFFEDKENKYTNDVTNSPFKGDTWCVVGGHRLWISPERHPRTYYPDDYAVKCTMTENGAILEAPEQEWTQMQQTTEITMDENGNVDIKHTVKNTGAWAVTIAPWTVTVCQTGGLCVIPQNVTNTGFFPNKWVCFWQYTPMNDERFYLGDKFITVDQKNMEKAAKLGVSNEHGYMVYFVNDAAFVKKFNYDKSAQYPDHNCNCECYTCDGYTEMECLSPLGALEAGDTVTHCESWKLTKAARPERCNEEAIAKAIDEVIK